ncbi:MAG TPA: hypothetical protein VF017_08545 [Thermoanaerobaculia bacterium]|nr:hypothetical protein [Thermoanaerobaculia bacterium]
MRSRRSWASALLLLSLVATSTAPAATSSPPAAEEFRYRWKLSRFLGVVASLFMPGEGDGVLSFRPTTPGHLASELVITSEKSDSGEHFRYGAELELATGRTLRAWSSSFWRGEQRDKAGAIDGSGVIDIASGIYLLRRDPPTQPRELEIWSDGKLYPVRVVPVAIEQRRVAGRVVPARHLRFEGIERPGKRFWKGSLELWLGLDAGATPVEIAINRRGASVHLVLVSPAPNETQEALP